MDDELLKQAKKRAAERGLTVSEVVNEALRDLLSRRPPAAPPFVMVTYGGARSRSHHEPSDFATALEDEDRTRVR